MQRMHVCMYVGTCVCMHAYMRMRMHNSHVHTYAHVCARYDRIKKKNEIKVVIMHIYYIHSILLVRGRHKN